MEQAVTLSEWLRVFAIDGSHQHQHISIMDWTGRGGHPALLYTDGVWRWVPVSTRAYSSDDPVMCHTWSCRMESPTSCRGADRRALTVGPL
jgi:hypothetical protein